MTRNKYISKRKIEKKIEINHNIVNENSVPKEEEINTEANDKSSNNYIKDRISSKTHSKNKNEAKRISDSSIKKDIDYEGLDLQILQNIDIPVKIYYDHFQ